MDITKLKDKGKGFFRKYKFVMLILLLGLVFMLLPTQEDETEVLITETEVLNSQSIREELEDILSCIQGAGQVRVMLTIAKGEEAIYQLDESNSKSENGDSSKTDTVILSNSGKNQTGLLRQTISPVYQGIIIVCQGADSAQVRLSIIDAVSKATGLGTNQISVVKMK